MSSQLENYGIESRWIFLSALKGPEASAKDADRGVVFCLRDMGATTSPPKARRCLISNPGSGPKDF